MERDSSVPHSFFLFLKWVMVSAIKKGRNTDTKTGWCQGDGCGCPAEKEK